MVQNDNGQMVPQKIEQHVIGRIVAEEGVENDQYELREILVPPEHQLDLIPKPKLIEAAYEVPPVKVVRAAVTKLHYLASKGNKKERQE